MLSTAIINTHNLMAAGTNSISYLPDNNLGQPLQLYFAAYTPVPTYWPNRFSSQTHNMAFWLVYYKFYVGELSISNVVWTAPLVHFSLQLFSIPFFRCACIWDVCLVLGGPRWEYPRASKRNGSVTTCMRATLLYSVHSQKKTPAWNQESTLMG